MSTPVQIPSTPPFQGQQQGLPADIASLLRGNLGQQPVGQGNTSVGPAIPSMPQMRPMRQVPQGGAAQGEFQTKGAHQRASMASLTNSITGAVSSAENAYNSRKNRELGQVFTQFGNAQKGIQQAEEMQQNAQQILQQDPNNAQAKQMLQQAQGMLQQNQTIRNDILSNDKHRKSLAKGFGIDDKNADTPERQAAIQAMQKLNPSMSPQTASFMSQIPQTSQISPMTQLQGEMVKMGVQPKAATGSAILGAETKAATTQASIDEKKREFDVSNVNAQNKTEVQAIAHGLKPNPDGQGYVPMTPEDLKKYPILSSKLDLDKSKQALEQAQQELAHAKAIGEPQRIAQANANIGIRSQELQIKQADLELKMKDQTRKERAEDFKEGSDSSGAALPGLRALSPSGQKVVLDTQPVLDQVNNLIGKMDAYKNINVPGYLSADRTLYAMGMKSNVAGELADQVANLELQKIVAAASVMRGSSRTIQALKIAMQHTPNVWIDSPALIDSKLNTIRDRLTDVVNDAYTYGRKGGYMPATPNVGGHNPAAQAPAAVPVPERIFQ